MRNTLVTGVFAVFIACFASAWAEAGPTATIGEETRQVAVQNGKALEAKEKAIAACANVLCVQGLVSADMNEAGAAWGAGLSLWPDHAKVFKECEAEITAHLAGPGVACALKVANTAFSAIHLDALKAMVTAANRDGTHIDVNDPRIPPVVRAKINSYCHADQELVCPVEVLERVVTNAENVRNRFLKTKRILSSQEILLATCKKKFGIECKDAFGAPFIDAYTAQGSTKRTLFDGLGATSNRTTVGQTDKGPTQASDVATSVDVSTGSAGKPDGKDATTEHRAGTGPSGATGAPADPANKGAPPSGGDADGRWYGTAIGHGKPTPETDKLFGPPPPPPVPAAEEGCPKDLAPDRCVRAGGHGYADLTRYKETKSRGVQPKAPGEPPDPGEYEFGELEKKFGDAAYPLAKSGLESLAMSRLEDLIIQAYIQAALLETPGTSPADVVAGLRKALREATGGKKCREIQGHINAAEEKAGGSKLDDARAVELAKMAPAAHCMGKLARRQEELRLRFGFDIEGSRPILKQEELDHLFAKARARVREQLRGSTITEYNALFNIRVTEAFANLVTDLPVVRPLLKEAHSISGLGERSRRACGGLVSINDVGCRAEFAEYTGVTSRMNELAAQFPRLGDASGSGTVASEAYRRLGVPADEKITDACGIFKDLDKPDKGFRAPTEAEAKALSETLATTDKAKSARLALFVDRLKELCDPKLKDSILEWALGNEAFRKDLFSCARPDFPKLKEEPPADPPKPQAPPLTMSAEDCSVLRDHRWVACRFLKDLKDSNERWEIAGNFAMVLGDALAVFGGASVIARGIAMGSGAAIAGRMAVGGMAGIGLALATTPTQQQAIAQAGWGVAFCQSGYGQSISDCGQKVRDLVTASEEDPQLKASFNAFAMGAAFALAEPAAVKEAVGNPGKLKLVLEDLKAKLGVSNAGADAQAQAVAKFLEDSRQDMRLKIKTAHPEIPAEVLRALTDDQLGRIIARDEVKAAFPKMSDAEIAKLSDGELLDLRVQARERARVAALPKDKKPPAPPTVRPDPVRGQEVLANPNPEDVPAQVRRILDDPKTQEYIAKHAEYDHVSSAENRGFIDEVYADPPKGKLFFEVENSVLKTLNDKVLLSKDLSNAITNGYKELFFKNLEAEPALRDAITSRYTDYKSTRIGFNADTPGIRAALERVYRRTADQYAESLKGQPFEGLFKKGNGAVPSDPGAWHLSGMGSTPDEAGAAARSARTTGADGTRPNAAVTPRHFSDVAPGLKASLEKMEAARQNLQSDMPHSNGLLVESRDSPGRFVLSDAAAEIMRKAKPEEVKTKLEKRFGIYLTDHQVGSIQKYYSLADSFSSSVLEEQKININLGRAKFGLVSCDFAGQGARNIASTMDALASVEGQQNPAAAVKAARRGLKRSADGMGSLNRIFEDAVKDVLGGAKEHIEFSGDDGMFMPQRHLTLDDKAALMKRLAEKGPPGNFRVTFVPESYEGGAVIPAEQRSVFVVKAETAEKDLRAAIEGKIPLTKATKISIAVDLVPHGPEGGVVHYIVSGNVEGVDPLILEKAMDKALPKGFTKGKVVFVQSELPVGQTAPLTTTLPDFSKSAHGVCPTCPGEFQLSPETIKHSNQHYPGSKLTNVKDASPYARGDRSTSVFSDGTTVNDVVGKLGTASNIKLDPKGARLLAEGSPTVAFEAEFGEGAKKTVVRLVTCVQTTCADDAGGVIREGVFKKGDVISIFPVCGPNVIAIPVAAEVAKSVAKFQPGSPWGTGKGKIKPKLCE